MYLLVSGWFCDASVWRVAGNWEICSNDEKLQQVERYADVLLMPLHIKYSSAWLTGGYSVAVEPDGSWPDDDVTYSWHVEAGAEFATKYHHGVQDAHGQSEVSTGVFFHRWKFLKFMGHGWTIIVKCNDNYGVQLASYCAGNVQMWEKSESKSQITKTSYDFL